MSYVPRILIADHEPRMCDSLRVLLKNHGYDVQTAFNGKEAIECFARNNFDVVLLDIAMPDILGRQIMDYINSQSRETLVIAMTGYASVDSAIECLRRGAYDYLRKPFDFGRLLEAVENALDERRLRKQHEQDMANLKLTQRRFRFLVNVSPDIIYTLNHEGEFTFVNAAVESLLGYKSNQLIAKHYSFIVFEEDTEKAERHFNERRTGERATEGMELRLKRSQNGGGPKILTVELNAMGIYDRPVDQKDKEFMGSYGVARDVTARKRLQVQLYQAQKMESIGTLAGGVAHDFNNLLMGIQGNVSLMLLDIDTTHPHHERLKNIEKQVQSGAKLTSHLIGYARQGRYEVKPIDLNRLVEDTSETFGRTRKEITIVRELAVNLLAIEADAGQIEQVLLNLFVNASDAMPGGGGLILKTFNVTHKDIKGRVYEPKPGNYVRLTVTDTGRGIDKETMGRIFEPFFTTKEMGRGTGLGLASTYGIIKGHGGYIDVESKKGHGTTFSIYLPVSEKRLEKAVKNPVEVTKGTGTVLLVDDEDNILKVGRELLEAMGYRVLTAKDGKEAIDLYSKNRDGIDVVLLDIVMPDMSGGEAYDRIKEVNCNVKVLLSSRHRMDGQATEILNRGCEGFIQKPFSIYELSRKIREIIDIKM